MAAFAAPGPATGSEALAAATTALCHRQVAVLGEAEHGDARTEAFKIALIGQLVDRCGYSAVLFEASFHEFVQLDRLRRGARPITQDQLATAIGGLWRFDREFQPLLPYLTQRVNQGTLQLGGIDFQLGGRGQDFANSGAVAELTGELPAAAQTRCRTVFHALVMSGSNPERRQAAVACTDEMERLAPSPDPDVRRERRDMLANLSAYAAADPGQPGAYIALRDRAMYGNFKRWMARWHPGTKVIVWTATAHAARGPHGHRNFAGVTPFGAYLARRYGPKVYALGFSSQGGTTRGRPVPRVIAPALPDSLEALAGTMAPEGPVLLDKAALSRAGSRPGGLFSHAPIVADWSKLLDGVVIFPAEAAATDIRQPG